MEKNFPAVYIDAVELLPVLNGKLLSLLRSLKPEDWHKPTVAKLWTVKDVTAHLLDGNIRILSMLRDDYYGERRPGSSHKELLDFFKWVEC